MHFTIAARIADFPRFDLTRELGDKPQQTLESEQKHGTSTLSNTLLGCRNLSSLATRACLVASVIGFCNSYSFRHGDLWFATAAADIFFFCFLKVLIS